MTTHVFQEESKRRDVLNLRLYQLTRDFTFDHGIGTCNLDLLTLEYYSYRVRPILLMSHQLILFKGYMSDCSKSMARKSVKG